jgi:hypothetical protein
MGPKKLLIKYQKNKTYSSTLTLNLKLYF